MKKESKIRNVTQIVMMSIALVTGLIFNTSCQQSDTEDPVTLFLPLDCVLLGGARLRPNR